MQPRLVAPDPGRAFGRLLAPLMLAGAAAAYAADGDPLVDPRLPGKHAELLATNVHISPPAFIAMVLDCDKYPSDVATLGVKAVDSCSILARTGQDAEVIYQRTGGSLVFTPRQAVLWIRVTSQTAGAVTIEWDLVHQERTGSAWAGPYAEVLRDDAIRMPVSHGGWVLDTAAHTVRYWLDVDLGGFVPGIFVSQDSMLALTRAMLARHEGE